MAAYYAKRASSYERIYHKPERQAELRAIEAWLAPQFAGRRVLEIACGTGWWTAHGARQARSWLATDLNPQTLDIARSKSLPQRVDGSCIVEFRSLDAYALAELERAPCASGGSPGAACLDAAAGPPSAALFDAAFAGCWWSHVPLQRLPAWLATLHARLAPGARVVMLDNRFVPGSSTPISRRDAAGNSYQTRSLDDGSMHEVLKNYPTPDQALAMLGSRAREPQWTDFTHYWILSYRLT